MSDKTIAEQHAEDVDYAVDVWETALVENLSMMLAHGRVPGIKSPSKAELRRFFEKTDALYWTSLAAADPDEAYSQLQQFQQTEVPYAVR